MGPDGFKVTDKRIDFSEENKAEKPAEPAQPDSAAEEECGCAEENMVDGICMPKVTFSTFVLSLSSSGLVALGEVPDPETGKLSPSNPLAKHTIDILALLEEKTKGNLTTDEERLLKDILFELRMKFVQRMG